jgi:hypothetical protein
MSLVTCRSCERSISNDAQYCVHCGIVTLLIVIASFMPVE